ncbi:FAD-dependent monooxygenase [Rhizobium sp. BK251]|uniref:FAD-dependent monooxygenase n=1 Tax=Rhizobium sp. BK251 TaxID=2512125 RepID=UPI001043DC44|nr:FAD-dependent monooxygenase [Rhizobium sp. BK251]TCL75762.1 2-polyprenyl-6-methoxyphenol hydroxylase-like FAD-dependent oxidoreductase [Rhizobium sp. BK251]
MNPKVLIVGAGPVGLTLAIELSRYGVPVRIIEKASARTDKSKAVAVWSRSLELLDRADLAGQLIAAGVQVRAASIVAGTESIGRVTMDRLDTPYPFALMIPQSETERILEARLAALGVVVERSVELKAFSDNGEMVTATVERPDGSSGTVAADWLVGCDGAHSLVRHGLGKEFPGETVPTEFVLADIRLSGTLPANEIVTFWHRNGVLVLLPLPGGRTRLIGSTGTPAGEEAREPELREVQAIIDERGPGGLVASDPVWMARFRINERKVEDFRYGRVFLAGDAAHVHSPAGGQGMNTGMQDAINLAWKLALVCHGDCDQRLLESYSIERSAVAAKVIADAGRLTRVAMLRNSLAQAARDFVARHLIGLQAVQRAAGETLAELSIGYETSPLNGSHAGGLKGPSPGHRLPPDDSGAIGAADRPLFAIFAPATESEAAAELAQHSALLEGHLRPPIDPRGIWLVRPDGYVAMTARLGGWQAVRTYLAQLKDQHSGRVAARP